MSNNPWFRFYSETLSDRKLARICRASGQPKAVVVGVWAILLSLANDSPQRGRLLISDDLELTPDEIKDETGLDADAFDAIIAGLTQFGLIATDGCWEICNWDKRQFTSDSSAERVRRHRKNKTKEEQSNGSTGDGAHVTLHGRYSNAIDTDTDTDTESDDDAAATDEEATSTPAIEELGQHFYRETNFMPDPRRPRYEQLWIEPLAHILRLTDGDVDEARALITAAVKKAWATKTREGEPFPTHTPNSIVTFATNIANNKRAAASTDDDETIWQRAMACIASRTPPTQDSRLYAAIKAVGWPKLESADEYSQQRLKGQLAHAYRSAT